MAEEHRGRYRRRLRRLGKRLAGGDSLPDALEQTPGALGDGPMLAIRLGDRSGLLPTMLSHLLKSKQLTRASLVNRFMESLLYVQVTCLVIGLHSCICDDQDRAFLPSHL